MLYIYIYIIICNVVYSNSNRALVIKLGIIKRHQPLPYHTSYLHTHNFLCPMFMVQLCQWLRMQIDPQDILHTFLVKIKSTQTAKCKMLRRNKMLMLRQNTTAQKMGKHAKTTRRQRSKQQQRPARLYVPIIFYSPSGMRAYCILLRPRRHAFYVLARTALSE